MNMTTMQKAPWVAAVILVLAGSASAQTTGLGQVSTGGQSTFYSTNSGASWGTYAPAQQLRTGTQGPAPNYTFTADGSAPFWAYCIDPLTGVTFPNTFTVLSSLDSYFATSTANQTTSNYATQLARTPYVNHGGLSNTYATQTAVKNDIVELFSFAYANTFNTNGTINSVNASAFGMALWEIILQDGTPSNYSTSLGRVRSRGTTNAYDTDAVETKTKQYLDALSGANVNGTGSTWASLGLSAQSYTYTVYFDNGLAPGGVGQTFIRATPGGPNSNPTPAPATLALAAAGLFIAARMRAKA